MDRFSKFGHKRRRRTAALRLLLLTLALWLCYNTALTWMDSFQSLESAQANTTLDRCTRGYSATTSERDPYSVDESISQHKPSSRFDGTKGQDSVQKPLRATSQSTQAQAVTNNDVELRPHTGFRNALYNVLSLLPDELHIRDLLRPLDGTGEEKIREMGLRTRSYKTLFEAWGALHLVANGKEMYIRDDVVQSLRRHPELADDFQMSLAQIIRSYEAYRSYMARLSTLLFPWTAPYFSDHLLLYAQLYSGGRGIVFSAGDHQAPFLLTSIPTLRQLGCDLPIEVMYLGDDDLSEDFRTDLESLSGVITRDLSQMVNDKGWKLAGWAGKPFAILFSSFREVIFIDADSLFFQTPEVLFDDPSYLETGALFFRDRLMMPELKKKWLQKVLPKPISKKATQSRFWTGESGHMQESGVVVVDKCKHFVALLLVTRMNGPDRDGDAAKGKIGVYDLVYGDKETFWLGWELAGDLGYAFHGGDAGIMGTVEEDPRQKHKVAENVALTKSEDISKDTGNDENSKTSEEGHESHERPPVFTICGPQLLHLGLDNRPLWFNGWLLPNKFFEEKDQEPANFTAYLQEPLDIREPGAWQLRENNICCLTSRRAFEFTREEKDVLEMIIDAGRRSGALGKGKN